VVGIHPLEFSVAPFAPNEFVDEVVMPRELTNPFMLTLQRLYRRWAPVWVRRLRARAVAKADAGPYLVDLAKRVERTVLIFSEVDQEIFRRLGGTDAAARLPGIQLVNVPTLDHPLFARQTRHRVIAEVRRQVADAFDLPRPAQ
jgi:hypothetical protein